MLQRILSDAGSKIPGTSPSAIRCHEASSSQSFVVTIAVCAAAALSSCGQRPDLRSERAWVELADLEVLPAPLTAQPRQEAAPAPDDELSTASTADAPDTTDALDAANAPGLAETVAATSSPEALLLETATTPEGITETGLSPSIFRSLDASPLDEIIRELDRRLLAQSSSESEPAPDDRREELRDLERRLVALSFANTRLEHQQLVERVTREIEEHGDAAIESKLLAAALLGRNGAIEDRDLILSDIFEQILDAPRLTSVDYEKVLSRDETPAVGPSFRLEKVCFATEIGGLGEFTARAGSSFTPGERVLVYGEFVDFGEHATQDMGRLTYERHFTATLKLLDEGGKVHDYGVIIDGKHHGTAASERLNFWAECTLPNGFDIGGELTLVIEAYDHLRRAATRTSLPVRVRTPALVDTSGDSRPADDEDATSIDLEVAPDDIAD